MIESGIKPMLRT